ncbi:putative Cytochrome p450 79a2 [Hibiscus syriacus]|uniref:Cytochrome p450 79a2 n=1 Tax=Hibiscus syriacus TaxID=106335 RepID=A0A6A2XK44_HIBSY|nr:uncharacterized protein LOC120179231 [Hibiscus syriacus]KAE8667465.1 putative Cytochrome p450 79a2 [Hibiscus syriacus]
MGDRARLAKARMELEELYLGIPDDSVNLTFQDLADMQQQATDPSDNNNQKSTTMDTVHEDKVSSLTKLPSLDFNRALQETSHHHQQRRHKPYLEESGDDFGSHMEMDHHHHHRPRHHDSHAWKDHQPRHATSPRAHTGQFRHGMERSLAYDDVSVVSMASNYPERGQRRRPGIPHSNICTICSTYIYIFRHRCLVCGRVYCRQCVCIGMGEMTEGRKCVLCLGRRFSPRYIKRAGKMGCSWRYPSAVKQAELKWAEKGPRRSGERTDGRSSVNMMSRARSPQRSPTSVTTTMAMSSSTPSFVASSPAYSPFSHHHLPL